MRLSILPRGALFGICAVLLMGAASDPAERLADPAREERARQIFREVRCMVCQNESIDDSNAELAVDLRRLVREQVEAGRSDDQIRHYLTDRYGEFVLLKPAFSWVNAALWLAPFAVVAAGLALLVRRWPRTRSQEPPLDAQEQARLEGLTRDQTS